MIKVRLFENAEQNSRQLAGGSLSLPGWLFYPFTALAALWMFVYVSGLFPYLGHSSGTHETAFGGLGRTDVHIGTAKPWQGHVVPMLKGQTVFVDYDVKIDSGYASLSITQGYISLRQLKHIELRGTTHGRLSVKADSTGFYRIQMRPLADDLKTPSKLTYRFSWGGLW